jgi:hypothetical protein
MDSHNPNLKEARNEPHILAIDGNDSDFFAPADGSGRSIQPTPIHLGIFLIYRQ